MPTEPAHIDIPQPLEQPKIARIVTAAVARECYSEVP
jgi:hypothetical protein